MVAARAAGLAHLRPGLNVNRGLAAELSPAFGWLARPKAKPETRLIYGTFGDASGIGWAGNSQAVVACLGNSAPTAVPPHATVNQMAYGCMPTSVSIAQAAVEERLPGGPGLPAEADSRSRTAAPAQDVGPRPPPDSYIPGAGGPAEEHCAPLTGHRLSPLRQHSQGGHAARVKSRDHDPVPPRRLGGAATGTPLPIQRKHDDRSALSTSRRGYRAGTGRPARTRRDRDSPGHRDRHGHVRAGGLGRLAGVLRSLPPPIALTSADQPVPWCCQGVP